MRHSEVKVGEIIDLVSGDGHETSIEDRHVGIVVQERVADVRNGRLRECVVLLLEDESDTVADFSSHLAGLVRNRVWRGATDDDLQDLGSSEWNEDEGKRSETSDEHDLGCGWDVGCEM